MKRDFKHLVQPSMKKYFIQHKEVLLILFGIIICIIAGIGFYLTGWLDDEAAVEIEKEVDEAFVTENF